jgi:NAD(P)-dependent dehydrogenase (short-subunit alcohol dehydrogenase family)
MPSPRRTAFATLAAGGAAYLARRLLGRRPGGLSGQVALVTGGSRGLGLCLARELGRGGARVALCARDEEELERARAGLAADGIDASAFPGDVTDREGMRTLVAAVEEGLGPVDLLVNNAGILQVGPAETMSLEDLQRAMDTIFWGAVHAADAVLPGMRARRRGTVVNVTSLGAAVAFPHLSTYSAAKFAMRGWSEALAAEAAKYGILVVTVIPGLMRTGSFGRALVKGNRSAEANLLAVAASLPLLTIGAEAAAREIVRAVEDRRRFLVLGLPARLLRLSHALFPGTLVGALARANRLLPSTPRDEAGDDRMPLPAELFRRGLARSVLTALGERAARENNEEPVARDGS